MARYQRARPVGPPVPVLRVPSLAPRARGVKLTLMVQTVPQKVRVRTWVAVTVGKLPRLCSLNKRRKRQSRTHS
jgi:hypothetical protein